MPTWRTAAPEPSSGWSTACSPRRTTASGGVDTGSTSPATRTRSASTPMRPTSSSAKGNGSIATTSSGPSTRTSRTTGSSPSSSPGTSCTTGGGRSASRPQMREALIATGYLRTARDLTHEDVGVIPQNFFGILHDTIEIVGTGLLGLTVNCARCHTHKFDPIPQEDYYRLMAVFTPAYNPRAGSRSSRPRRMPGIGDCPTSRPPSKRRSNGTTPSVDRRLEELRGRLSQLRRPAWIACSRPGCRPARIDPGGSQGGAAHAGRQAEPGPKVPGREVRDRLEREARGGRRELEPGGEGGGEKRSRSQITATEASRRKWGKIQALYDVGTPPRTHLLDPRQRAESGARSAARILASLVPVRRRGGGDVPRALRRDERAPAASLARWLTCPESPASALRGAGDGQPDLETPLRPGDRADTGQLRRTGATSDASRAARMAELRTRRQRLADQAVDQADDDVDGLSTGVASGHHGGTLHAGPRIDRSRRRATLVHAVATARSRRSSAMRSWPSAAI